MTISAFESPRDDTPVTGNGLDVPVSVAPSIYLLSRTRSDLDWFGDNAYEVEVNSLDRFLGRDLDFTRRTDSDIYAFWCWPVNDSHRIERLLFQRFCERFGRPSVGRRRFLAPDVELAYREIAGMLDMSGMKVRH